MRLSIEDWLDEQNFSEDVNNLFRESFLCYKASAYRASLVFSFLGFQTVIKERILRADKPGNLSDGAWEAVKKEMREEETWDKAVNDCISRNKENTKIFLIPEDLRRQAMYWRDRRNDCAHFKSNTITHSHVESLWFFLTSNIPKFVVAGSVDSLIDKIDKHFNPDFTSRNEKFDHLITEAKFVVSDKEIEYFIEKIKTILRYDDWFLYGIDNALQFWNELINLGDHFTTSIVDFMKREEIDLDFLAEFPNQVYTFFSNDPSGVRNLWRSRIIKYYNSDRYGVLCSLITSNLVKEESKIEVFDHIIFNIGDIIPTEKDKESLVQIGFVERYKKEVFVDGLISNFNWAKNSTKTVIYYLDTFGLDDEIVEKINSTFTSSNYPFKLRDRLSSYFHYEQDQRQLYLDICDRLRIVPTSTLGF